MHIAFVEITSTEKMDNVAFIGCGGYGFSTYDSCLQIDILTVSSLTNGSQRNWSTSSFPYVTSIQKENVINDID